MDFDVFNDHISRYNNEDDINLNFTKLSDYITLKINVSERNNGTKRNWKILFKKCEKVDFENKGINVTDDFL